METEAATSNEEAIVSRLVGPEFVYGESKFFVQRPNAQLYVTEMSDYTIVTDHDFTEFTPYAVRSLKEALQPRWCYVLHVSHGMQPSVQRHMLNARVVGGQVLGYKYMECSIEGNECVYYGYVPTVEIDVDDSTHRICRYTMQAVYPRKLYVYLQKQCACMCTPGCVRWLCMTVNGRRTEIVCSRQIPWERIYVMMGDGDENFREVMKEPRQCIVCAQCFECSKGAVFCRKHRVCRHKQAVIGDGKTDPSSLRHSEMKHCVKLSRGK